MGKPDEGVIPWWLSSPAGVDAKTRARVRLKCDLPRAMGISRDTAGKICLIRFLFRDFLSCLLAKELARCLHGVGFNLFLLEVYKWGVIVLKW